MNVATLQKHDEATVEDAKAWVKAMGERGKWTKGAVKARMTALDALASVLGPENSRKANEVLANVDILHRDWARKNNADGATAATYGRSVRSTLGIYLEWLEDPAKAQAHFDAAQARPRKVKAKATEAETPELPLGPPPPPAVATTTAPKVDLRAYPLGEGRSVIFGLPEKFTTHDLAKLSCHLATYCEDFDPTRPNEGTVMAMARTEKSTA